MPVGVNEQELAAVFRACKDRVYAAVRRKVPDADVEDVVSEVFLAGVQSWRNKPEGIPWCAWIMGIAKIKIADYWRKRSPGGTSKSKDKECSVGNGEGMQGVTFIPIGTTEASSESEVHNWMLATMLDDAMACLTPEEQKIVKHLYSEQKSERETAKELSVSRRAVITAKNRLKASVCEECQRFRADLLERSLRTSGCACAGCREARANLSTRSASKTSARLTSLKGIKCIYCSLEHALVDEESMKLCASCEAEARGGVPHE